ncbi:hypothetical protein F3Y22_tig00110239pilonHSYRG00043 [Hibiscus syriacus]|uniref:NPK1-activating kinesin-like protein C-terminal domain-containing protein n=1 Tax=Hibiscus syriacus TaxID=106335 RepID=A0A6A3B6J4_HIBSY|nr:hypothetical protein F3Y22_tig00110239pilonHSYRG00043 [Hibiscus syriacus]
MLTSAEYSSSNSFKVLNASTVDYSKHRYTVSPNVRMTNNQYLIPLESYEEEYHPDGITPLLAGPDTSNGFNEVALKMGEELEDDRKEEGKPAMEEFIIKEIEADHLSAIPEKEEEKVSLGAPEGIEGKLVVTKPMKEEYVVSSPQKEGLRSGHVYKDETIEALKQKLQELQKTIKCLVTVGDSPSALDKSRTSSGGTAMSRSRSCRAIITTRKIIELWDACNVPLIHRTYFIMLFKGDPSDSIYMEVVFRRLSFLKNSMPLGSNGSKDYPINTAASSVKDLGRERKMLCKQIQKMFSKKQKEELYKKWGIELNSKQRSLQLSQRIWTKTQGMGHVKESAALVAKLLGFAEPGQAPKEVVGLSILPRSVARKSRDWKNVLPPLL